MTKETWDSFLTVMEKDPNTTIIYNIPTKESEKKMPKKEYKDIDEVLEAFAAKIADKEDNPSISEKYRDADRREEANNIPLTESQKQQAELEPLPCLTQAQKDLVNHIQQGQDSAKRFGRGGFGEGSLNNPMYLKELQRSRIRKKLDLIKDKLGDVKQIIMLLEEQLAKLK